MAIQNMQQNKISFIVIGLNEDWRLSLCLKAVKELIAFNSLQNTEIIYVDSDSTDNSIEFAKEQNVDKIFKISGNINAAIARNVGVNSATGELLFFIDGDIVIKPFDLNILLNANIKLKYGYVVGFLDDVNYTSDWQFINQAPRNYKFETKDRQVTTAGSGIFIIEKETWLKFKGMDERLRRTQDRDLSLRMAKKGIVGIRKAEIFGLHHTIPYNNSKRMWKMLFDGSLSFKGVFIRKHLFNRSFLPNLLHEEWTISILITTLILSIINPLTILLYTLVVLIKIRKQNIKRFFQVFAHRVLQDLIVVFSFLLFYPMRPKFITTRIK